MAAKPKSITDKTMVDLATKVMGDNKQAEVLKTDIEAGKKILKAHCRTVFFKDLGAILDPNDNPVEVDLEKIPEINGNFEFSTTEGLFSVNFKTKSMELDDIDGNPAPAYLSGVFNSSYKDLFEESDRHTLKDPKALDLYRMATEDPDQFMYSIQPNLDAIGHKDMAALAKTYPQRFVVYPKDMKAFAKANPALVNTKKVVTPSSGFIEGLSKVEKTVLKNAQTFLVGFFKWALDSAAKCGNAAKK